MAAFHELGGDVVVKPLFGSEGRGMVRVTDVDCAYRVFKALELGNYIYYLQEFVPHNCEDIRVLVIGGEAVAAMVRRGETGRQISLMGRQQRHMVPDDTLQEMSIKAARVLGAVYAGVDILPIEGGGYTLTEVNGIPGWRGLQSATGVDVAELLLDHILNRAEMVPLSADEIAWAAQIACLLEVNAWKPGNVTRLQDFPDCCFEDFSLSAVAIGPAFLEATHKPVGMTILRAVRDTHRLVDTNTNLGMVLLLAPLAKAAGMGHSDADYERPQFRCWKI